MGFKESVANTAVTEQVFLELFSDLAPRTSPKLPEFMDSLSFEMIAIDLLINLDYPSPIITYLTFPNIPFSRMHLQ